MTIKKKCAKQAYELCSPFCEHYIFSNKLKISLLLLASNGQEKYNARPEDRHTHIKCVAHEKVRHSSRLCRRPHLLIPSLQFYGPQRESQPDMTRTAPQTCPSFSPSRQNDRRHWKRVPQTFSPRAVSNCWRGHRWKRPLWCQVVATLTQCPSSTLKCFMYKPYSITVIFE